MAIQGMGGPPWQVLGNLGSLSRLPLVADFTNPTRYLLEFVEASVGLCKEDNRLNTPRLSFGIASKGDILGKN
jgi:hypothetical protein